LVGPITYPAVSKSPLTRQPASSSRRLTHVKAYFAEMGRIAVNIGHDAKDVVLSGNPDKAAQLADDDAVDELHSQLFTIVLDPQWPHPVATAVDVTLLSRYYERFADHAVTVGRRVIFQATGSPII
jgi:phosphate transport system protein